MSIWKIGSGTIIRTCLAPLAGARMREERSSAARRARALDTTIPLRRLQPDSNLRRSERIYARVGTAPHSLNMYGRATKPKPTSLDKYTLTQRKPDNDGLHVIDKGMAIT